MSKAVLIQSWFSFYLLLYSLRTFNRLLLNGHHGTSEVLCKAHKSLTKLNASLRILVSNEYLVWSGNQLATVYARLRYSISWLLWLIQIYTTIPFLISWQPHFFHRRFYYFSKNHQQLSSCGGNKAVSRSL